MNSPLFNPLDKFASYSIHHVMLVCRSTMDAEAFTDVAKNRDTLAAIDQTSALGEAIQYGATSRDGAYIVMDTRRFSQFSVQNLTVDVLVNALRNGGSPTNMVTTVAMTVLDAGGISFVNFLMWLIDYKLKTNFSGMIFMHRIIFVGHNADGSTETVQGITIPMMLKKMELNLDYSKGAYTLEFLPNTNFDTKKNFEWTNIGTASRFFTGKDVNNLGGIIDNFQKQLNDASQAFYDKTQLAYFGQNKTDDQKYGRLVQYMITIPKEWRILEFSGAATAAAKETIFKKEKVNDKKNAEVKSEADKEYAAKQNAAKKFNPEATPGTPKDTHLSVESGLQITEVLDIMLNQVPAIAELGVGRKTTGENGAVTFYRHHVGVTSDDDKVIIHVDVIPFEVPNVVADKSTGISSNANELYQEGPNGRRVPKNYAEFDYIYTGKNKDILNFDMKIENLLLLFASNINVGPNALDMQQNVADGVAKKPEDAVTPQTKVTYARAFDPIFLPLNTTDEQNNFAKYTTLGSQQRSEELVKTTQDYQRNLALFYATAPIEINMTIRGNPDIMRKFNQNQMLAHNPPTSTKATTGMSNEAYRTWLEDEFLKNNAGELELENGVLKVSKTLGPTHFALAPVFVAINIRGPRVDAVSGQALPGEYSDLLFPDNFYVCQKITNKIEGHTFTQELHMRSQNIFGMGYEAEKAKEVKAIE